jgi:hypothetical protein
MDNGFFSAAINASERIALEKLPDMDASDIEARMDLAIVEFVHVNRREPTQIEMEIILSGGSAQATVAIAALERHLQEVSDTYNPYDNGSGGNGGGGNATKRKKDGGRRKEEEGRRSQVNVEVGGKSNHHQQPPSRLPPLQAPSRLPPLRVDGTATAGATLSDLPDTASGHPSSSPHGVRRLSRLVQWKCKTLEHKRLSRRAWWKRGWRWWTKRNQVGVAAMCLPCP